MTERPMLTMICTGNAARSVMAALLLRDRCVLLPRPFWEHL